jgi:hypothetical protein
MYNTSKGQAQIKNLQLTPILQEVNTKLADTPRSSPAGKTLDDEQGCSTSKESKCANLVVGSSALELKRRPSGVGWRVDAAGGVGAARSRLGIDLDAASGVGRRRGARV